MYKMQASKKIDVETASVIITNDSADSVETTTIRVQGKLHKPLFKQHYFEGSFVIDGIEATTKDWQNKIHIMKHSNGVNMGGLLYSAAAAPHVTTFYGVIYFDDDFEQINIVTGADWIGGNQKDSLYIVTGTNYGQAVETQDHLREQFDRDDWFMPKARDTQTN
ncbi:hypothetical protein PCCS19_47690 [Paenibacillus sp. CCS19]|uniref:hypothetical protein n=1 Tax=Paenibacillus sp. CCS19 TaxID=3158387 RepID=UPI0025653ED0|nr:hypothetical protein [Paenibacillus cellulosilyticus]GMK41712.1 hypothetical protein PCCS19_47690 [Paenibacillus cellulosilyticus]